MQVCTSSGMYAGKIFLNVQSHSHGSKTLDLSMRLKSFRGIHLGTSNVNVAEDRNQISTLKILNMGHRSSLRFLKYGCISKQGRRGCQYYLVGTICPPPCLVEIGLTYLPKSGGAIATPAPPGTTGFLVVPPMVALLRQCHLII